MPPKSPSKAAEPVLGLQMSRLLASFAMYVIAAAVLYHKLEQAGTWDVIKSHVRAAPWNTFSPPCGLLPDKEFVILSDRVQKSWGLAPGAGELRPLSVP